LAGLIVVLAGLVWLMLRVMPNDLLAGLPLRPAAAQALAVTTIICLSSAIFLFTHTFQHSALDKLRVLDAMPLSRRQRLGLYMYSFLPVTFGIVAISVPACYRIFGTYLSDMQFWATTSAAILASVLFHICVRITTHRLQDAAQPASLAIIIVAYLCGNKILSSIGTSHVAVYGAWAMAVLLLAVALAVMRLPVGIGGERKGLPMLLSHKHLTVSASVMARALRTGRYLSAVVMTMGIVAGMLVASYRYPERLPFDVTLMVGILLVSTLAQEIRSLSRKIYPLEAVQYGQVFAWLRGQWLAVYFNCAVVTGVLLLAAHIFFAGSLSVSMPYAASIAAMLAAIGVLTSSIVVPQKNDILSQLGSTLVYAAGAWAAFKYLSGFESLSTVWLYVAAGAVIAGCLAISYSIEKMRWLKTIKGTYGKLF
jgi:hypothetical protein